MATKMACLGTWLEVKGATRLMYRRNPPPLLSVSQRNLTRQFQYGIDPTMLATRDRPSHSMPRVVPFTRSWCSGLPPSRLAADQIKFCGGSDNFGPSLANRIQQGYGDSDGVRWCATVEHRRAGKLLLACFPMSVWASGGWLVGGDMA